MTMLAIMEKERAEIAALKEYASQHPVAIASSVILHGYRAAYSVEQQPAGMCAHLSVGVVGRAQTGCMPSPEVVALIADEFGIPFPPNGQIWTIEYEPGEFAVNLLHVLNPMAEGRA